MKTKVVLTRHGQTNFNAEHRLDGNSDTSLTKEGLEQADRLAEYLAEEDISAVYCSPLSRSRLTLEAINKFHKLPMNVVESFMEIDCGDCTGLTVSEIEKKYPELIKEWAKDTDPIFPGGENMRDVEARVMPSFLNLVKENEGKTFLIAGHGTVNLSIIGGLLQIPPAIRFKIKQSNCCINIIEFENDDFAIRNVNFTI